MSEENAGNINWDKWESNKYIKLKAGKPKVLTITAAQETTTDITQADKTIKTVPCIIFKVANEDGKSVDSEFSVTSRKLVASLKPIIQRGFPFTVKITSYGSGFEVEYVVEEIKGVPHIDPDPTQ